MNARQCWCLEDSEVRKQRTGLAGWGVEGAANVSGCKAQLAAREVRGFSVPGELPDDIPGLP